MFLIFFIVIVSNDTGLNKTGVVAGQTDTIPWLPVGLVVVILVLVGIIIFICCLFRSLSRWDV